MWTVGGDARDSGDVRYVFDLGRDVYIRLEFVQTAWYTVPNVRKRSPRNRM
jgi:hypothetical protein